METLRRTTPTNQSGLSVALNDLHVSVKTQVRVFVDDLHRQIKQSSTLRCGHGARVVAQNFTQKEKENNNNKKQLNPKHPKQNKLPLKVNPAILMSWLE